MKRFLFLYPSPTFCLIEEKSKKHRSTCLFLVSVGLRLEVLLNEFLSVERERKIPVSKLSLSKQERKRENIRNNIL